MTSSKWNIIRKQAGQLTVHIGMLKWLASCERNINEEQTVCDMILAIHRHCNMLFKVRNRSTYYSFWKMDLYDHADVKEITMIYINMEWMTSWRRN